MSEAARKKTSTDVNILQIVCFRKCATAKCQSIFISLSDIRICFYPSNPAHTIQVNNIITAPRQSFCFWVLLHHVQQYPSFSSHLSYSIPAPHLPVCMSKEPPLLWANQHVRLGCQASTEVSTFLAYLHVHSLALVTNV